MSTWLVMDPDITFSRNGFDSVMCGRSDKHPDLWTENESGDLYGISASAADSFIQKSTDRGRSWSWYCPSQGPNNLVDFIFARRDSIWIFGGGLGRTTLDTTVYRTQSYLRIRLFKNGVFQSDTSLFTISGILSRPMRDGS